MNDFMKVNLMGLVRKPQGLKWNKRLNEFFDFGPESLPIDTKSITSAGSDERTYERFIFVILHFMNPAA